MVTLIFLPIIMVVIWAWCTAHTNGARKESLTQLGEWDGESTIVVNTSTGGNDE